MLDLEIARELQQDRLREAERERLVRSIERAAHQPRTATRPVKVRLLPAARVVVWIGRWLAALGMRASAWADEGV